MHVIKRIHPSATVFLGILLAFALPFAQVVESCGSEAVNPTGVELLLGDVKPIGSDGESEFAEEVERQSRPFAWLVAIIAFAGLVLALFRRGARWGLCSLGCLASALALGVALEGDDYHHGYQLVLGLSAGAVALRLFLALARRARRPTRLDPPVSTAPSEAA